MLDRLSVSALAAVLALSGAASVHAQQDGVRPVAMIAQAGEPKRLTIGDDAPAIDIANFVKGEPVKGFEKGKVYVVEFWATWCGPCIQNMPHLTKMQQKYKDKGLTIIGISSNERKKTNDKGEPDGGLSLVKPFVERMGDRIGYTIGLDNNNITDQRYMQAAGQSSIPAAFVVDKQGKLAWFGHPMNAMDLVVAECLEGTFDPAKHVERMKRYQEISERFNKAATAKDWSAAETEIDAVASVRPDLAHLAEMSRFMLLRTGKKDVAAATTVRNRLINEQFKDDPEKLRSFVEMLQTVPDADASEKQAALDGAQRVVTLTDGKDPMAYALVSNAYKSMDNYDGAIEAQKKAIAAAGDNEGLARSLKAVLAQLEQQKPGDKAADKPADGDVKQDK
jgi:thiol-disulfide isomerase/thioredoxin